jgi:hypothetical protein
MLGQDAGVDMLDQESLVTREFLALNCIFFLNTCNVAVFFHLHTYLQTLPVPPTWSGFLVGAFALSASIVRPFLGFRLHPGNVSVWIFLGAALSVAAFFSYNWASDVWGMALVHIIHGVGYGTLFWTCAMLCAGVFALIPLLSRKDTLLSGTEQKDRHS